MRFRFLLGRLTKERLTSAKQRAIGLRQARCPLYDGETAADESIRDSLEIIMIQHIHERRRAMSTWHSRVLECHVLIARRRSWMCWIMMISRESRMLSKLS